MKINTYRTILEQMWQKDKMCFALDAEFPPLCLRCGKGMRSHAGGLRISNVMGLF